MILTVFVSLFVALVEGHHLEVVYSTILSDITPLGQFCLVDYFSNDGMGHGFFLSYFMPFDTGKCDFLFLVLDIFMLTFLLSYL